MDIWVFHRDATPNALGFDQSVCEWSKIHDFTCVEMVPARDNALVALMQMPGFEATKTYMTFWINSQLQSESLPYAMRETDYIGFKYATRDEDGELVPSGFIWFYKIVRITPYEVMPGCCEFKVIGERLEPRECEKMAIECGLRVAVTEETL